MEPAWASLADDQLLQLRICDLGVRIEGSELEPRVRSLYGELEERGLPLKPDCYLGDEWFSPDGAPAIAIPFFLAHPRLKQLELRLMLDVEGGTPEWCDQLLRHECGHAYEHAWRFSDREDWGEIFGDRGVEYLPETYRPRPYSKGFVRHLPNWYAQAHPDEDFAETFAVWLSLPEEDWRAEYKGWKAIEKLAFVGRLMADARETPPAVTRAKRVWDASRSRRTLAKYYAAKRKLYAEEFPDFYDPDLRAIFGQGEPGSESAAQAMRRLEKPLVNAVVRWTGQRKYIVWELVKSLKARVRELRLQAPHDQSSIMIELASYLSALVTNHLHTGKFKRSV